MPRRSLFDKLWKHGAEIPIVFPGMLENVVTMFSKINNAPREVAAANIRSMFVKTESLFKWGSHPLTKAIDGLPPSIISMRARESFRVNDYPWGGEAGINVLDSAAYSGMSAIPSIAAMFESPPGNLRGRELRTTIIGSWLRNGRTFTSGGVRPARDADYSDPGAMDFVVDVISKDYGSKIMDELIITKRSYEKIDKLVTSKLIENEQLIKDDDDLDDKKKREYLDDIRSSMRVILERRHSTRFAWKLIESSDPDVSDFAARKWVVDVIEYAGKRLQNGGKRNREVLEKLFEPALTDGKVSRAVEGKLSPSSSVTIMSSIMTTIKLHKRGVYCDIFSVLSSSENPLIRGDAQRAIRDDCSASRF